MMKGRFYGWVIVVAALVMGCTGSSHPSAAGEPPALPDTMYTQEAAMNVYGYQPVRALQIIDSAFIVGNVNEVWREVNRARIFSQSRMGAQLDSLLGGPEGVRFDTARVIGERLLQRDSSASGQVPRQDVLEILITTARLQQDSVRWLQRSRELVEECRKDGQETEALRTEAEIGAALCFCGQQEEGMAMMDRVIEELSLGGGSFNELDAFIIAAKRKIGVLASFGREEETLPLARRMKEALDDYEAHPERYHDGSYREPTDDAGREDYIRFYRTQAEGFITAAYTALGDKSRDMVEAYKRIQTMEREATAREHIARYNALEQQMEAERQAARAERQQARANNIRQQAIGMFIILLLLLAALAWYVHQKRVISEKNRALVRLIEKRRPSRPTPDPSRQGGEPSGLREEGTAPASPLFTQIHDAIVSEQLYLNPACDRQMLTDRFQITKETLGALFAQHSEANNVSAYINALRLDHAAQLLASRPDMDIQSIAAASGFSSHRYFSTCFKQQFGLSPTDYRKAKREEG